MNKKQYRALMRGFSMALPSSRVTPSFQAMPSKHTL